MNNNSIGMLLVDCYLTTNNSYKFVSRKFYQTRLYSKRLYDGRSHQSNPNEDMKILPSFVKSFLIILISFKNKGEENILPWKLEKYDCTISGPS